MLIDDGSSELIALDLTDEQALWVRVGPVYNDDGIQSEPGVWIEYQEKYLGSGLKGPVLIDVETWKALNKAVRTGIRKFNQKGYGA